MLILAILVLGLFSGWIAHLIVGHGRPDWGKLLIVGFAGSFVGGMVLSLIFGDGLALRPSGILGSILGAIIVLAIWQAVESRKA